MLNCELSGDDSMVAIGDLWRRPVSRGDGKAILLFLELNCGLIEDGNDIEYLELGRRPWCGGVTARCPSRLFVINSGLSGDGDMAAYGDLVAAAGGPR